MTLLYVIVLPKAILKRISPAFFEPFPLLRIVFMFFRSQNPGATLSGFFYCFTYPGHPRTTFATAMPSPIPL